MCKKAHWYDFRFCLVINLIKVSLVEFWNNIKEDYPQLSEKTIKILFFFPLHICVGLDFLYMFKTKQHIKTHLMGKQIGESTCLQLIHLPSFNPEINAKNNNTHMCEAGNDFAKHMSSHYSDTNIYFS